MAGKPTEIWAINDNDSVAIAEPAKANLIYVGDSTTTRSNVTVDAGDGNDTIQVQYATKTYVDAGNGNDLINLLDDAVGSTVLTGAGNDTVTIFSTDTTQVELGGGNNVIQVCPTLKSDAMLIVNVAAASTLNFAYANNASISNAAFNVIANSVLHGTKGVDTFNIIGGASTIFGYGGEDNIVLAGATASTAEGSNDVTLSSSDASVVVKGVKGNTIKINGTATKTGTYLNTTYSTPQEVIKAFMNALDATEKTGTDALDEAILALNSEKFASIKDVIDAAVADCKNTNNADIFLHDYCGILLDNADTGALGGWDAGGTTVKNAESIVPESGALDTSFGADSFTTNGVTFVLGNNKKFADLTDDQKTIFRGLKTWWAKNSLDLISSTYGTAFSFSGGTDIKTGAKTIKVVFDSSKNYLAQVTSGNTTGDTASDITLTISMNYYKDMSATDVNGAGTATASYLDRTLAHEMTHAIMAATINDFGKLPAYLKEGMAELTHGIDDTRWEDIYALAGNSGNLNKALSSSTSNVSINKLNAPSYAGGYILLRYLAQQVADSEMSNGVRLNAKKNAVVISIDDKSSLTSVDLTETKYSGVVTVDASSASKAIFIAGNSKDNLMYANSGYNMTISGGKGKDKLYGSAGSDTFVFEQGDGADIIGNTAKGQENTLYQSGDKLVIIGDADNIAEDGYLSFKDSKNVVTMSFKGNTSDKITINKSDTLTPVTVELRSALDAAAVKKITYGEIPTGVSLDSKFTTAAITSDATVGQAINLFEINSQIKAVDGKKATVPVSIVGNAQPTTVSLGASGGTVQGGYDYTKDKGLDDKFYGNSGSDVFVYSVGGGKDQIFNYEGIADSIVLLGVSDIDTITTETNRSVSFKDNGTAVVVTVKGTVNGAAKTGTLTLQKPEGKIKIYKDSVKQENEILNYGIELDKYVHYNDKKTAVTLESGYNAETGSDSTVINIDLSAGYPLTVKELNASSYVGKTSLVGNSNADVLRASKGGSTIDAGTGAKSTGDKIYGNEGSDVFIYKIIPDVGGGTDVIGGDTKNTVGNYGSEDRIIITSGTGLTAADITIKDAKNVTTLTFNGNKKDKLTINKQSSDTAISIFLAEDGATTFGSTPTFVYGEMPEGVSYGKKGNNLDYTALSVGSAAAGTTINSSNINSQIKNFNLSSATNAVYVLGNSTNNAITLGAAGGTVDGGEGNDKIYGSSAATVGSTFVYTLGEGKDEIYGYNGNQDTIIIKGYDSPIDISAKSVFKDNGKDISLTLTSGTTKGTLVIKSPSGKLTIVDENKQTLLSYGKNLPDPEHMSFNSSKTLLTIDSGASLAVGTVINLKDYGVTLKDLDASAYSTTGLHLIASDGKASILRAGDAASTLQGGTGADKLYGGGEADSFVYEVGSGKDEIYNFNGNQKDEILLVGYSDSGIVASNTKIFKDTGKDITMTLGNNKLTLKSPTGQVNVFAATINADSSITKGAALLTYDSNLASGISYNATKTMLTIDSSVSVATTLDASKEYAYANTLKIINASTTTVNVALTGNNNANDIYAGTKASTLNGGGGNDRLFGMTGASDIFVYDHVIGNGGKDVAYNYNAAEGDVISLSAAVETGGMKVTYNGKTLVFNYVDKIDGKSYTGSLTVNGKSNGNKYAYIDTATTVAIQVGTGDVKYYQFRNTKLKNLALDAAVSNGDVVTVSSASSTSQFSSSAEDYWFDQGFDNANSADELDEIFEVKPTTSTLEEFDAMSMARKNSDNAFVSTDIRKKKALR